MDRPVIPNRGGTVRNPPGTTYSAAEWAKGYAAWLAVLPIYLSLWLFATVCPRIPEWARRKLLRAWEDETTSRQYDVRIPGTPEISPYMLRWWKIARNAFFNCYFHLVKRSDDDTALHDHPWWNFSIVLEGGYWEHRILAGGVHTKKWYGKGSVLFRRSGDYAHRLELPTDINGYDEEFEQAAKTIFITGPVLRRWGFHHPERWVDAYEWDQFLSDHGIQSMKMAGYAEQLKKDQS